MKIKKGVSLLILVLSLSVVLTACGGGETNLESKEDLIVAQGADATTLDPQAGNDQPSARVMRQIYDTLVVLTEDMELEPGLAESWEQIDDLTWEFKIREGVKFHNGDELTPEDVKFTIERHMESPTVSHILELVKSVEVIEDNKIIMNLDEPFAAIIAHLSHGSTGILNQKAVEEAGEDYGQRPMGTGPFKFVNWTTGDSIELERNDDYFGEGAKVKYLTFKNVTEGTSRTLGIETGEIDISYDIDPIDIKKLSEDENLVYISEPSFSVDYLGLNNLKEPFNDIRVRQALNYAINVEEIIEAVVEGDGEVALTPLQKDVFGATTDVKRYEYNPEKAKELLAEAGYPDGFETSIMTNDSGVRVRIAELIQGQLKAIGVDTRVQTLEWGAYLDATARGEHEMFMLGWSANTGDADYGLSSPYLSENHGEAGNRTFYSNEEFDRLVKAASKESDPEMRKELYKEAQQILLEDSPNVLLFHKMVNAGTQKYIKGFRVHPAGSHVLKNVYFEE